MARIGAPALSSPMARAAEKQQGTKKTTESKTNQLALALLFGALIIGGVMAMKYGGNALINLL